MSDDNMIETSCVYLGRALLTDGKFGERWITETRFNRLNSRSEFFSSADGIVNGASLFKAATKPSSRRVIGGIYTMVCEIGEDGTIVRARNSAAVFERKHEDASIVLAWTAADTSAVTRKRQFDLEKRLGSNEWIEKEMQALRAAYLKTPHADRMAFEFMIMKILRS